MPYDVGCPFYGAIWRVRIWLLIIRLVVPLPTIRNAGHFRSEQNLNLSGRRGRTWPRGAHLAIGATLFGGTTTKPP
jgi:hypothetical protein